MVQAISLGPCRRPIDSAVFSGGAGGARAPPEFGVSQKGQSLISAYNSLAISTNTLGFEKLNTALEMSTEYSNYLVGHFLWFIPSYLLSLSVRVEVVLVRAQSRVFVRNVLCNQARSYVFRLMMDVYKISN